MREIELQPTTILSDIGTFAGETVGTQPGRARGGDKTPAAGQDDIIRPRVQRVDIV
ncbi:MAG: hypothetical protein ACJ74Z_18615 [Bryobacteraceae bacterium]